MEVYISTGLSRVSLTPVHSSYPYRYPSPKQRKRLLLTPTSNPRSLRSKSSYYARISINSLDFAPSNDEDSEFVEVIGIGSRRKDAVLDFCLHSPIISPDLRFWNLIIEDSTNMQLHQFTGKEVSPTVMEFSSGWESCFKAVILVATADYASDHIRVLDILKGVKSANRLAVGIIIKPFSFEGRRRQAEVKSLLDKLQEHTDFCIGIDPDVLLEKDFVTLHEALKTANTAVLMAINAVSILVSESKKKFLDSAQDNTEELEVSQILEILEGCKQAEVGFGVGYNIKTSTMRAIYDCPFLRAGLKGLDGIVICILASSDAIERSDVKVFLRTLRKTEFKGRIIHSLVYEPNLEPNHIITTVVTVRHRASQESSILSRLSQHFPFIFNLFRRNHSASCNTEEGNFSENPTVCEMDLPDSLEMSDIIPADSEIEGYSNYPSEIQTLLSNEDDGVFNLSVPEAKEIGFSEPAPDYSSFYDPNIKGVTSYQREPLIRKFESVYSGQEDCGSDSGDSSLLDKLSIYRLPVGVKPSAELKSSYNCDGCDQQKKVDANTKTRQIQMTPRLSTNTSVDAGSEAVSELFDTGSLALKGTCDNISKREGVLSTRAASMLVNCG